MTKESFLASNLYKDLCPKVINGTEERNNGIFEILTVLGQIIDLSAKKNHESNKDLVLSDSARELLASGIETLLQDENKLYEGVI